MTNDHTRRQLLEIYKLHSELADRVSQRREGANRLYVSLLAGLMVLTATLLRYGNGELAVLLAVGGLMGTAVSLSWLVVIRSHRQLNGAKFKVLHKLEKKLAYPFFTREWQVLRRGSRPRYRQLSAVEMGLPWFFLTLSVVVLVFLAVAGLAGWPLP